MHALDVVGDPVRRRILELLAETERPAGDIAARIGAEFSISQPAVSQHLKVLRDNAFVLVQVDGARRIYALNAEPLQRMDQWLDHFRHFWEPKLDALATEIARGKKARRKRSAAKPTDRKSA